jgi:hypothetical protein
MAMPLSAWFVQALARAAAVLVVSSYQADKCGELLVRATRHSSADALRLRTSSIAKRPSEMRCLRFHSVPRRLPRALLSASGRVTASTTAAIASSRGADIDIRAANELRVDITTVTGSHTRSLE